MGRRGDCGGTNSLKFLNWGRLSKGLIKLDPPFLHMDVDDKQKLNRMFKFKKHIHKIPVTKTQLFCFLDAILNKYYIIEKSGSSVDNAVALQLWGLEINSQRLPFLTPNIFHN